MKSLVVILPCEEVESVVEKVRLSGEERIFSSKTKTVEETHIKSRQRHEREVNWEFNFRQFSRLIGYSCLDQSLVNINIYQRYYLTFLVKNLL